MSSVMLNCGVDTVFDAEKSPKFRLKRVVSIMVLFPSGTVIAFSDCDEDEEDNSYLRD